MWKAIAIGAGAIMVVYGGIAIYGARRWVRLTGDIRSLVTSAEGTVLTVLPSPTEESAAAAPQLPAPVKRYLRLALAADSARVVVARIAHEGTFNLSEGGENWKPFVSDQLASGRAPAFDWDGRVTMMPGLAVRVHDAYAGGEGILHAALLGAIPIANARGGAALADGELMRYLAESVWYPTVLLPGAAVTWRAIDDSSALAILRDGPARAELVFTFGADGMVDRVRAAARGRMTGGSMAATPWEGRFWHYAERDGLRIPLEGEVAWVLDGIPAPYWRGRVTSITYVKEQLAR